MCIRDRNYRFRIHYGIQNTGYSNPIGDCSFCLLLLNVAVNLSVN